MDQTENFYSKRFSAESDFFIAVCSASLFVCYQNPGNYSDYFLVSMVGLGTFLYYRFLHSYDYKTSAYRLSSSWLGGSIIFGAGILILNKNIKIINYANLIAVALLMVYQAPLTTFKLRDIPYLKSILISVFWCYFLVWLPVSFNDFMFSSACGLLFENFLFILALSLIYDSYDRKTDENYGLKTLVNFNMGKFSSALIISLLLFSCLPWLVSGMVIKSELPELFRISFYAQVCATTGVIVLWYFRGMIKRKYKFVWDGFILLKAIIVLVVHTWFT